LNARADFLEFIADASGTHAFAGGALQGQRKTFESLPIINPDNADPAIYWGDGDPNIAENLVSQAYWRRSRYLENTELDGLCSRYLGWAWITLVFDRWEDDFRHRYASEIGCTHDQVMCDVMGELRHLRHDVSHNKGIATRGHSGKCVVLGHWFTIGAFINISGENTRQFYDLIYDESAVYRRS
jgi:hypothetical protein